VPTIPSFLPLPTFNHCLALLFGQTFIPLMKIFRLENKMFVEVFRTMIPPKSLSPSGISLQNAPHRHLTLIAR
jgi:hypothetical protein